MNLAIADLHCDLLAYLALSDQRSIHDVQTRCSLPQLQQGNVKQQVLAIYSQTGKNSTHFAQKQVRIFKECFRNFQQVGIEAIAAIENASGFFEEDEPLSTGFARFNQALNTLYPVLYLSLTWNDRNRFGGGNKASDGLTSDGELLLDFLAEKNIAVDMSHTCDFLAFDIINYIEKKDLPIKTIASHSNFRKITDMQRNLPDEIAQYIIANNGCIGINFIKKFVGEPFESKLIEQLQHGVALGGENHLCFGADFFCDLDFPQSDKKFLFEIPYDQSNCYPFVIERLQNYFSQDQIDKFTYKNFEQLQKVGI